MNKIISVVLLVFSISLSAHLDEFMESDSGIEYPAYAKIQEDLLSLSQEFPEQSIVLNIGKTLQGRDISAILIYDRMAEYAFQQMVLITGATHGNEYLHIADRLPGAFLDKDNTVIQNYIAQGGAILVVPIMNPDGFESRSRYNANGTDLNRDYPNEKIRLKGLKEPETKHLVGFVQDLLAQTNAKLNVAVDYHCCDGSMLYPLSYTKARIPQADLDRHVDIALKMKKYFPQYRHGITGEVLGYFPRGTSKDYWYLQNSAAAFTFEGAYKTEQNLFSEHVAWWTDIFSSLSLPYSSLR